MRFLTLENKTVRSITTVIERTAHDAGLTNVFNPSVATVGSTTHVAFRAAPRPGQKPFHAYLLRVDADGGTRLVDLADTLGGREIAKVADPKLVMLGADLYVTFNTGNVHAGQNDIFLRRVTPDLGPLQRCVYGQRRPVEKNWAFYLQPGEPLRVIYALAPLTVLELSEGELGVTDELVFEAGKPGEMPLHFPSLHIGSQPLIDEADSGRALVVANQRVKVPPTFYRKIYLGRLAEIDLASGTVTRLSRRRLMHSWQSMLPPQRERHNPVLWSATYFSGLARSEGELLLGYGVNDKSLGVARIAESSIWG